MEITYSKEAKEDLKFWQENNVKIFQKIESLLMDIQNHPFSGIGKPERLRFEISGYWSRRINREHRLVYKVTEEAIYIVQCRYHY